MSKIIHVGNAVFVDSDPVEGSTDIYPYASFRSLEHVEYGLKLMRGGPEGEELDSVRVGEYGMEPISQYHDFNSAIDAIEKERARGKSADWIFEDVPYVEITSEEEYNEALDALEIEEDEGDLFDGPGLYDFRDSPPTYQGTVEENELTDMEQAADDAFEFMFQGDEWQEAFDELNAEEEDTDEDDEDE